MFLFSMPRHVLNMFLTLYMPYALIWFVLIKKTCNRIVKPKLEKKKNFIVIALQINKNTFQKY